MNLQTTNTVDGQTKKYDLEERTLKFAKEVINFTNKLPRTIANIEIIKQLLRSSGSVGANYIEANEALSKKDFIMHVKICKKEAKESRYWLRLVLTNKAVYIERNRSKLEQESIELEKIFCAIINSR
jgi:four helix bundle protein